MILQSYKAKAGHWATFVYQSVSVKTFVFPNASRGGVIFSTFFYRVVHFTRQWVPSSVKKGGEGGGEGEQNVAQVQLAVKECTVLEMFCNVVSLEVVLFFSILYRRTIANKKGKILCLHVLHASQSLTTVCLNKVKLPEVWEVDE